MIRNPAQIKLLALGLPATPANDSGGGPTSSTTTTSNIPEYLRPYAEDLLKQTQAVSGQGYVPYGGPRIAAPTAAQNEAANRIGNMGEPTQLGQAASVFNTAAQGLGGMTGYQTDYIGSTYNPTAQAMYGAPGQVQSQYQPGDFTGEQVAKYMSPYQQNVTDIAKREASRQFNQQQVARDAGAAQRGSFGGDRAALVRQEAVRGQNQLLDDIQSKGDQQAYQMAMQQFNANQSQQQAANQMQMGAAGTNASNALAYGNASNQMAQFNEQQRQQAANMAMQGQVANANAQAQAAGIQMNAYNGLGSLGGQFANLGQTQQALALQRAQALNQVGTQQQQTAQQALDAAYQDFVNQRDYPRANLSFYSSILHGVPAATNSDVQTYQAAPSTTSQLAGLGIAGAAAYNMFNK